MVPNQLKDLILPVKVAPLKLASVKVAPFRLASVKLAPLKSTPGPTIHCSFVPDTNL